VQVLAPLAMWLRETNPTAGLVARPQLEDWLTDYYQREWSMSRGEARARGREFLEGVHRYSNLLVERGERQYGFLHLTLEEMLAAKGVAQLADGSLEQATGLMTRHLADPAWHETLLLAVGAIGIVQQRPAAAGKLLLALMKSQVEEAPLGANVVLAGEALLDVGEVGVGRGTAARVTAALVDTMQDPACHIRERRDAGVLLGRLNWRPEPEEGDLILAPEDPASPPSGVDAFRRVGDVWVGKYLVTNLQYARFVVASGYDEPRWWTGEGWAWRTGRYDSKAPAGLQAWLIQRPPEKRNQPFWWEDRGWNSPLQPVVGVSWFEAMAYCAWLTSQLRDFPKGDLWASKELGVSHSGQLVAAKLDPEHLGVRLPAEAEWEEAMGGPREYPWGEAFDLTRLNCADAWAGRDLRDRDDWMNWILSSERQEASTTAVTTFPQGHSHAGVWDGSGNVWEWMANPYEPGGDTIALRGGSWGNDRRSARVSCRDLNSLPGHFTYLLGFRVVVAPVLGN
jgi:formylglycine-generating enzyme required for sulfatase activity